MCSVSNPGTGLSSSRPGLISLVTKLAKAKFSQVSDQGQAKDQIGQSQGQELDNISMEGQCWNVLPDKNLYLIHFNCSFRSSSSIIRWMFLILNLNLFIAQRTSAKISCSLTLLVFTRVIGAIGLTKWCSVGCSKLINFLSGCSYSKLLKKFLFSSWIFLAPMK